MSPVETPRSGGVVFTPQVAGTSSQAGQATVYGTQSTERNRSQLVNTPSPRSVMTSSAAAALDQGTKAGEATAESRIKAFGGAGALIGVAAAAIFLASNPVGWGVSAVLGCVLAASSLVCLGASLYSFCTQDNIRSGKIEEHLEQHAQTACQNISLKDLRTMYKSIKRENLPANWKNQEDFKPMVKEMLRVTMNHMLELHNEPHRIPPNPQSSFQIDKTSEEGIRGFMEAAARTVSCKARFCGY